MAKPNPTTLNIPVSLAGVPVLLALLYQRLGGSFSISSNGGRYYGRPEPVVFRLNGGELPQIPDAKPHEKFHNADQWKGAIKLVEAMLQRLDDDDTDLIFDLFARAAVDDRKLNPSIEEPKRRIVQ